MYYIDKDVGTRPRAEPFAIFGLGGFVFWSFWLLSTFLEAGARLFQEKWTLNPRHRRIFLIDGALQLQIKGQSV